MANTAERVVSGELADVSRELCSATPLERRSFERIAELSKATSGVGVVDEEEGRRKKSRRKLKKVAPVDEGEIIISYCISSCLTYVLIAIWRDFVMPYGGIL